MESALSAREERMPRKRVITEARREQNRIAQLAWRRRQKEIRLQKKSHSQNDIAQGNNLELKPKKGPETVNCLTESRHCRKRTPEAGSRTVAAESSVHNVAENRVPLLIRAESEQGTADGNQIYGADMPHLYPLPILKSSTFFPSIDYSTSQSPAESVPLPSGTFHFNGTNHGFISGRSALFPETAALELSEQDEISQSSFSFWGPTETASSMISHDSSIIDDAWKDLTRAISPPKPARHTRNKTTADNKGWDITMPLPARNISLEDIVAAGMQVLLFNRPSHSSTRKRIQSTESPFHLPSPYSNTLDIARSRTLSACLHNAHSMGFVVSDVIKPFCIAPSMFYRPQSPGDDLAALVASASASNPNMPENLRPTLPQVLHPHPAFLDLIPIPGFRNKVILAAVRRGWENVGVGGLDLFELKRDIFQDGLSWQSSDNYSDKSKKIEPWDMMSWEASGWFVKKWSCLIDDSVSLNA